MKTALVLLGSLVGLVSAQKGPPIVRVASDSSCTDQCHGQTWAKAYNDFSAALSDFATLPGSTFWLKEGTYKPTNSSGSDPRHASFEPAANSFVYGGFRGTEDAVTDRVKPYPPTYLDGNIGDINDDTDNVYHVVFPAAWDTFDGLIIRNGYADGDTDNLGSGGGVYVDDQKGTPTAYFKDCTFANNTATQGAAAYFFGVTKPGEANYVTFEGCTFENNYAPRGTYKGGTGGGIHAVYGTQMSITNSVFKDNVAETRGGGVYQDYGANITFTNVNFVRNTVRTGHGGGHFGEDRNSQFGGTWAWFTNSTFKDNTASGFGGGVSIYKGFSAVIKKSRFVNNKGALGGGLSLYDAKHAEYTSENTFKNNQASSDSTTNDVYTGTFPAPTNVTYGLYSEKKYLQILWDNAQSSHSFNIDQIRARERLEKEKTAAKDAQFGTTIVYCNVENSGGSHDGSSWNSAYDKLQDALDHCASHTPCELWIAAGKYIPTKVPSFSKQQTTADRSFILYSDIELYGGFDGTETQRTQRDWNSNPTYIWGGGKYNQMMVSVPHLTGIRIDGLIFKRGYGVPTTPPKPKKPELDNLKDHTDIPDVVGDRDRVRGSGLFINSSVVDVVNTLFIENVGFKGGATYCMGFASVGSRSPTFTNVAWINNLAHLRGGGLAADAYCDYTLDQCLFVGNRGVDKGGQVYNDFYCSPTVTNSTFRDGVTGEAGGAFCADGAGYYTLTDVIFDNNTVLSSEGGALYVGSGKSWDQTMTLSNVQFTDNSAPYGHDDVYIWENMQIDVKSVARKEAFQQSTPLDLSSLPGYFFAKSGAESSSEQSMDAVAIAFAGASVFAGLSIGVGFVYFMVRKKE